MNVLFLSIHSEISQRLSAILKIYYIKSNLFNFHSFYGLINVSEQADEHLIIDQCLKFLQSCSICLLAFNWIVFEQMKRFVSPANFGFSTFLLGKEKSCGVIGGFILMLINAPKSFELNFPRITFFSSMALFCCNTKLLEKSPLWEFLFDGASHPGLIKPKMDNSGT